MATTKSLFFGEEDSSRFADFAGNENPIYLARKNVRVVGVT